MTLVRVLLLAFPLRGSRSGCETIGAQGLEIVVANATFGFLKHRTDVGFNNPVGRARTSVVDLLEPADAFNIPVSNIAHKIGQLSRD
jgi:hypothetical protein